jgi:hypothetical protein
MKSAGRSAEETRAVHSVAELIEEIERYLETVALFRALGCEPRWRDDTRARVTVIERIAVYVVYGPS